MRIEESQDGTLKVVELDPQKRYLFVTDNEDLANRIALCRRLDGMIIVKPIDTRLAIVEGPEAISPQATQILEA